MKSLVTIVIGLLISITASAQSRIIRAAQPTVDRLATCPFRKSEGPTPIFARNPFKIKLAKTVSSENGRVGDYLEFKTMEPIYSVDDYPQELFPSGTSIFAIVTWRKHRGFPFRGGQLEIALEPLLNWDGGRVEIGIKRHGVVRDDLDDTRLRSKPCNYGLRSENCIAGRRDARVAPVVTAVAGASSVAVGSIADDDKTRFIAATAFFSIAKELGDLLNGTDAALGENEIFDLYIAPGSKVCVLPKKPSSKPDPTEVILIDRRH